MSIIKIYVNTNRIVKDYVSCWTPLLTLKKKVKDLVRTNVARGKVVRTAKIEIEEEEEDEWAGIGERWKEVE